MRIQTSGTLVSFLRNKKIVVFNFLTKNAIHCEPSDLNWLTIAESWISIEDYAEGLQLDLETVKDVLSNFIESNIIVVEHSEIAGLEKEYSERWELGPSVGLFHFSSLNNHFLSPLESVESQLERQRLDPSPDLYWRNSRAAIQLDKIVEAPEQSVLELMARRRSQRVVTGKSVKLEEIAKCLYAGLGITSFVKTDVCTLPLKMVPSGGARNPFESFVWAKNVEGLEPGLYHYSALDNSLELVDRPCPGTASEMLMGQDWADEMAAVVFLVAVLPRTTWKYTDPNAYRVVMIEAGHIAQNMMLVCTENQLTACPTAAINHAMVSEYLGLQNIAEIPLYSILIGHPTSSSDEYISVASMRNLQSDEIGMVRSRN